MAFSSNESNGQQLENIRALKLFFVQFYFGDGPGFINIGHCTSVTDKLTTALLQPA